MQSYEIAGQLSLQINLFKAHQTRPVNATDFDLEADNAWGAAYFFAELLQQSRFLPDVLIDRARLDELAAEFQALHSINVDPDALLAKHWLRHIFGYIVLPDLIHHAVGKFKELTQFPEEFRFFDALQPEQVKTLMTEADLQAALMAYDARHGTVLRLAETKNLFWYPDKERIKLPGLDHSRFLLANAGEFRFLTFLVDKGKDNELRIDQQELETIHARHGSFFDKTPALAELTGTGTLVPELGSGQYKIQLCSNGWSQEALRDKYAALLWQHLLEDPTFSDDEQRLRFWYYRTVYRQGYVHTDHFFPPAQKTRFLETALRLVTSDPDIGNGDDEYYKLRTDTRFGRDLGLIESAIKASGVIGIKETDDLFELYANLGDMLRGHHENTLYDQRSRHELCFLIAQLVRNDTGRAHNLIGGLFENARNRPFVFWYTCMMISHWRPELLPFLALKEQTASLAFLLFIKSELTNYTGKEEKSIWQKLARRLFSLIAINLAQTPNLEEGVKARIIFQCLFRTALRKFKIAPQQTDNIKLSDSLREAFAEAEMPGTYYDASLKVRKYFFTDLLAPLADELAKHEPVDIYQNGMVTLPFVELDFAVWLLSLSPEPALAQQLIFFFKDRYLAGINITEVTKRDFFGDKQLKPTLPSWSSQRANEELPDWPLAFLLLEQYHELESILSPASLVFSDADSVYDEGNRFTAQKMRTHLFVLIEAFNQIFQNNRRYRHQGYPVKITLDRLERRVTDLIVRYSVAKPAQRRYDIFNESLERWFGGSKKSELLPLVGVLINRFSRENREAVVLGLTKSEHLLRSMKMLEHIVSEPERRRLLSTIAAQGDFLPLLEKISFNDMQFVVSVLSANEEFIQVAEDALAYAEMIAEGQRFDYQRNENNAFIFRMKLLQAFQKRDLAAIDRLADLPHPYVNNQPFQSQAEKDFYRALIFLRTGNGQQAYLLYHELVSNAREDRPVLALNRFASKLQWAEETDDPEQTKTLAYEALMQWQDFQQSFSDLSSWPSIKENVWYNRLLSYQLLGDTEGFDRTYAELDPETRMRPDFLAIRIDELVGRKLQHSAEELLEAARQFHQLADGSYPDFVLKLEKQTNTPQTLAFLSGQYDRIFRLQPEELIQVVPPMVNGGKDLPAFILNELIHSAKDMLRLVHALPNINYEDKYTDLLMLSLNGRLVNYKWHAETMRGGSSDNDVSADNPGEIDMGIKTSSGEQMAICEALILEGKNTIETQKHNLKIFNYDPARKLYFMIVYYKGNADNFDSAWNSYCGVIDNFIEFPAGYALNGTSTELPLPQPHEGIRVAESIHGTGTRLYHIFLNVNYRLALAKKAVGT